MFKCICGTEHNNYKALNYHKKTRHNQCSICYKWFITENELNTHITNCNNKIELFNNKMNDFENDNMMQIIKKHLDDIDIPTLKLSYKLYVYSKVYDNPYFISSSMITEYLGYSQKRESNNLIEDLLKENIDYTIKEEIADLVLSRNNGKLDARSKEYYLNLRGFRRLCMHSRMKNADYMKDLLSIMADIVHEFMMIKINEENRKILDEKDKELEYNK